MKQTIKIFILLLLASGMAVSAFAQSPKFIVYFISGKCSKTTSGKVLALKKGDKLQAGDKITIGTGGKAILICSNFNTVQLNTPKVYQVNDLYNTCIKAAPSFSASYFRFVWDEFSHPHSAPEKEPEKYMKTAGAVTRGNDPVTLLLQPDTIRYFNGPLALRFLPLNDSVNFTLYKIVSRKLMIVKSVNVKGFIPLSTFIPEGPGQYQWQLADAGTKKLKGPVRFLTVYSETDYQQEIAAVLSKVIASGEAENAFMSAFLLEQHQYFAEASKYYLRAVKLQPENKIYRQMANRF